MRLAGRNSNFHQQLASKDSAAMTSVSPVFDILPAQASQFSLSTTVPTPRVKNVAVLGSTGSIGKSTLEVIAASNGKLAATALSAHASLGELAQQATDVRPRWLVATDAEAARKHVWPPLPAGVELLVGTEGLERAVTSAEVDVVVSAIVGSAGLRGTWAALEAGKTVALANKETLVMAGPLVTDLARRRGTALLPVDSEHSAIFQALQSGKQAELRRVVLTASGGPFRNYTSEQLARVTVDDALAHPTWKMGPKITVDSATLMNKALEIIEARWLFDLDADQIAVVIHPQSIVHSMVEWVDGSVIAQLSPPDMKLPIQYALTYPERQPGVAAKFDWSRSCTLEFAPADAERYPALGLGMEAARRGGTTGSVLNAANEAAVAGFLKGKLNFNQIVPLVKSVLEHHHFDPSPSLDRLLELDKWARQEVMRCIGI
jgi:1-deoxy-D-xylulose-5-phosphate reductoisomerase